MPTYEYACDACHHEWEHEQSIKEDALKECPACHEQAARRQISRGTGFILKGGGWYSDLYSSSSNKKPDPGTSESKPAPTTTTSESKSDSTPSTSGGGGGSSSTSSSAAAA